MVYTEHYYPRMEEPVAEFNTRYLGGTAHELGHGLALPHDSGSPPEHRLGVSLMGLGNHNYRREAWGGGRPAYLSVASAMRLVSHPLVTGSDRGRWAPDDGQIDSLRFSSIAGTVRVEGTVTGTIPPYAAIAHVWPTTAKTDHGAWTYPVPLEKGGAFAIDLDRLPPGSYHLKLAGLHANGSSTTVELPLAFDAAGRVDPAALEDWLVDRAEQAVMARRPEARTLLGDQAIASAPTSEARRKLGLLRAVLEPPAPVALAAVTGDRASLSDAVWTDAKVGWGQAARNAFWFNDRSRDGVFLRLGGKVPDKGLYAHSPSRYTFPVDGKWKTFRSTVGLRDGAHPQGSAIFTVLGDGKELARSRALRVGQHEELEVAIVGVKELELRAEGAEGHNHSSWAIWVEPEVRR